MNLTTNDPSPSGIALQIKIDFAQITVLSVAFAVCAFGLFSNSLVLHVTRKSKNFPLQHILAIGDLIFCLSYFLATPPRVVWVVLGMYKDQVPGMFCMLYPWFHSFNVGFIWPSVVTLAIAVERFLASSYPIWYRQNWENRLKKSFIRGIYVSLAVLMAPGWVLATILVVNGQTTQRQGSFVRCTSVYGNGFYVTQSAFGTLAGILCAVLSLVALGVGKRRRAALNLPANDKFLTTHRKMEKTILAIVVASVLLVAIPSSFRMLEALKLLPKAMSDSLVVVRRYFLIMLIANSALNFWLYVVFNSQFRKQAMRYILGKMGPEVGPAGGATIAPNKTRARLFAKSADNVNEQPRMEDRDR
ncbi:MAG: G-protein coupled receptor [Gammaproteobacteria bacterium]|nr:G-protein coupled receptor [Gammaproteobacteria bacterium]